MIRRVVYRRLSYKGGYHLFDKHLTHWGQGSLLLTEISWISIGIAAWYVHLYTWTAISPATWRFQPILLAEKLHGERIIITHPCHHFNTLGPRQNGCRFADDIFKCIFLDENVSISIDISLKYVPKCPINNIPALVQIMAWRRPGDKSLPEPMLVGSLTHIYASLGLNELMVVYSNHH